VDAPLVGICWLFMRGGTGRTWPLPLATTAGLGLVMVLLSVPAGDNADGFFEGRWLLWWLGAQLQFLLRSGRGMGCSADAFETAGREVCFFGLSVAISGPQGDVCLGPADEIARIRTERPALCRTWVGHRDTGTRRGFPWEFSAKIPAINNVRHPCEKGVCLEGWSPVVNVCNVDSLSPLALAQVLFYCFLLPRGGGCPTGPRKFRMSAPQTTGFCVNSGPPLPPLVRTKRYCRRRGHTPTVPPICGVGPNFFSALRILFYVATP